MAALSSPRFIELKPMHLGPLILRLAGNYPRSLSHMSAATFMAGRKRDAVGESGYEETI
jgi:hypothetical protein